MNVRRTLALALVAAAALAATRELTASSPASAAGGLRLVKVARSLTGTHEWYQQTYAGLPVLGGYYGRHVDLTGHVLIQDGRLMVAGLDSSAVARVPASRSGAGARAILPGPHAIVVRAVVSADGRWRTLVDARTGAVVRRELAVKDATGQGRLFDPSPTVTLRDESLRDQKDADYPALQAAYVLRPLPNLDGSGFLRGSFADVAGTTSRAFEPSLSFLYGRSDDRFEQTMAYYAVDGAQTYIQSLGFSDVNNEPQRIKVDQLGTDNSFYNPGPDFIKLGKGGVDDGEDLEVIWHEYGHAIQDDQVPHFGSTLEAGAIGEGFGDYWAVTMSEPVSNGFDLPCVADWDSVEYRSTIPHCLRRIDLDLHYPRDLLGEVHSDGRIWSRALWDIHLALGQPVADRIILESQFSYRPDTSFRDAAIQVVGAAQRLYGKKAADVSRQAFQDRGIL